MATSEVHEVSTRPTRWTRVVVLVGAVAVAVAVNLGIASLAVAGGAPAGYGPLSAPALILFTVVPMALGWFGWQWVRRHAKNPGRTQALLVVVVLLVSFIPDVILAVTGFIPGTTTPGVVALMCAHLVVMGTAVAAYVTADRL